MLKKFLFLILSLAWVAQAAAAPPPDEALKVTTEQLQKLIQANHKTYQADLPKFYEAVDDVVVPRFDVPYIAQLVLATNYKPASDEHCVQEHDGQGLCERDARQLRLDRDRLVAGAPGRR